MNYINKGKRDILIFPKFNNINIIQNIRYKYDELAHIIHPHITLAYPFNNDLSNEELAYKLRYILKDIKPFKISLSKLSLNWDNRVNTYYIFLNIDEGKEKIQFLHDLIYEYLLTNDKAVKYNYIPHITLGNTNNPNEKIELKEVFETIIDTIYVESIGDNEESNIILEIKL